MQRKIQTEQTQRSTLSLQVWLEVIVTGILMLALALPRLPALNRFVTTDERLWLERSGKFYYALAHHDFAATFQKSHPGVTVMWAGLTGYLQVYPQFAESEEGQNRPTTGLGTLQKRDYTIPLRILIAGRRTMILFHVLALLASFLFARQLFGLWPALQGFLLIAFDPFHIALSRILHLDGLLADLMLLAVLAFLVHLEKRDRVSLIVASVSTGLAWLTKSPGLFLIPLMALLALLYELRQKKTLDRNFFIPYIRTLMTWGLLALVIVFLLWPAMWVDPINSVAHVISDAIGYAQSGHDSAVFFNGTIYPNGEIPDPGFYGISFLWRTTPITMLGLLLAIIFFIRARFTSPSQLNLDDANDRQRWYITALFLLALGFTALMTLGLKKFDRYILPAMLPLDLIAGIGLAWFAKWIGQRWQTNPGTIMSAVIFLAFTTVQAIFAWQAFPYYFNYYNPLLGGARNAVSVMQIGWGEGLDQAADYLNNRPNADKLRVMAWYGSAPFSYFSKSQVSSLDVDHPWSADDWNQFNKSDYVVTYIHEWQRNLPAEVLARLKGLTPEYTVWIDGLEYAEVYKVP